MLQIAFKCAVVLDEPSMDASFVYNPVFYGSPEWWLLISGTCVNSIKWPKVGVVTLENQDQHQVDLLCTWSCWLENPGRGVTSPTHPRDAVCTGTWRFLVGCRTTSHIHFHGVSFFLSVFVWFCCWNKIKVKYCKVLIRKCGAHIPKVYFNFGI